MKDYYKIIGVDKNSDFKTIKNTYLLKLKKYHPDVYAGDKVFAQTKTSELNEAYDVLKDEKLRKEYDLKLNKKNGINVKIKKNKNVKYKKTQKQNEARSWVQVFWDNIKYFNNRRKQRKVIREKEKYAKQLQKTSDKVTDEELEQIKDKRKLTILIWCMLIAVVIIIFALT